MNAKEMSVAGLRVARALLAVITIGILTQCGDPKTPGDAAATTPPSTTTSVAGGEPPVGGPVTAGDADYPNYRLRNGETLPSARLHYATLGTPHRDAAGAIDNAILMLHWTGADGAALLSDGYRRALFDAGR